MVAESLTLCKLIILYMLNRVEFNLTSAQLGDFILLRDYADYMTFSQAQNELLETALISISKTQSSHNRTHLCITSEGRDTLRFFQGRISDTIKNEMEDYLKEKEFEIRNELSVYGDYYKATSGEYEAHLVIQEHETKLIDLTMSVPTEELAEHLCDNWQEKSEGIYKYLTDTLF